METAAPTNLQPANNLNQQKPNSNRLYLIVFIGILLILALLIYIFLEASKTPPNQKSDNKQKISSQSAKEKKEAVIEKIYVTAKEGLNLREEQSTSALITLLLPYGTELKVISSQGDWYFVEAQTKGFVHKDFVSSSKPSETVLLTFNQPDSPFKFLYPEVYKVTFQKTDNLVSYNFSGNESFGGFKVEITENMATLGNFALTNYPQAQKGSCEPIRFGTQAKECEKVVDSSGTTYLLLVNTTLYKITYLKTEGGLLTDLNNLVFYSMYFD